jgi:hypothetical protein
MEKNGFFGSALRRFRMNNLFLIPFLCSTTAIAGLSKIDALGMIESGNNDSAIGSSGEVSRFQIKPHIWREYSSSRSWRDVRVASLVAQDYLTALEGTFRKRARREPTDFDLYVLWNAGPAYYSKVGFAPERVHRVIRERARRFVNLREMRNAAVTPSKPPPAPVRTVSTASPLAQIIATPLPSPDSNALSPSFPGLALPPLESHPIPAGRGGSSFLSAGGMRAR